MMAWRVVALLVLVGMVAVRIWDPLPLQTLRQNSFDWYQLASRLPPQPLPTQIIAIDEESIAAFGQWPWSRARLSVLVGRIRSQGAAAIGLDIPLSEPDRLSPPRLAGSIDGLAPAGIQALKALPDSDVMLAKGIEGGAVVVGRFTAAAPMAKGGAAPPPKVRLGLWGNGDIRRFLPGAPSVISALPVLERAADGLGLLDVPAERDGTVRRLPVAVTVGDEIEPSLGVEMMRLAAGAQSVILHSNFSGIDSVQVDKSTVATDPQGEVWFRARPHDPARFISAARLLDNSLPPDGLAGRMVLVGVTAPQLDRHTPTVFGPLPEVEIQAQFIDSLAANTALWRPDDSWRPEVALTILSGLALVVFVPRIPAQWTLPLVIGVMMALGLFSFSAFVARGLLIDVTHPILTCLLLYLLLEYSQHRQLALLSNYDTD